MADKEKKKEESAFEAMSRRIGENIQSQLRSVITKGKSEGQKIKPRGSTASPEILASARASMERARETMRESRELYDAPPAETAPRIPSSKPTQLDLTTPAAQAEFNRFASEAPSPETAPLIPKSTDAPAAPMGNVSTSMGEAVEAEPVDMTRAASLFAKTHGGQFDPKSSVDKKKMATIIDLMSEGGSSALTPNQFALRIYRKTK